MDKVNPTRRYCVDCKFCVAGDMLKYARCEKTASQVVQDRGTEYIDPAFEPERRYCSCVRTDETACGPDAAWFEDKNQDAGEWISWPGGARPVPGPTVVDVRYNNGDQSSGEIAGNMIWDHRFKNYNIVAYRVAQASQQAAE